VIELIATVVITFGSAALFVYWWRYTYRLLLGPKTIHASKVAAAYGLGFPQVCAELRRNQSADLVQVHAVLDRDFAALMTLLSRASDVHGRLEERMIRLAYRVLGVWCLLSRSFSRTTALRALQEMCRVVAHYADLLGSVAEAGA
jgi:hypothetical protein